MDLWAVGCVMYELATLRPLFPGSNELDQVSYFIVYVMTKNYIGCCSIDAAIRRGLGFVFTKLLYHTHFQ